VLDGFFSKKFKINAGVPQGSIISPTLFIIFINDLLSTTAMRKVHSFAADSTLDFMYSFEKSGNIAANEIE